MSSGASSPAIADEADRASKLRRVETNGNGGRGVVTRTHRDLGPPFTDDYFPYTKGQLERCFASRRYDDHKRAWNTYYASNTTNGYKDRHYILREFVELGEALRATLPAADGEESSAAAAAADVVANGEVEGEQHTTKLSSSSCLSASGEKTSQSVLWMEIGCGVGNAVMPALRDYPALRVCGFDISSVAIGLFKQKAIDEGMAERVNVCVTNLAEEDAPTSFKSAVGLVDFASIIFVLSAVPKARHCDFLRRARAMMRTGGVLFFRDYYEEDMAQKRFGRENRIDEKTFFRVDGTLSYFFNKAEIAATFGACGFALIEERVVEREVENRKEQSTMQRRWYQARFRCV